MKHTQDREPVVVPIDGTLDLHTFSPKDIPSLVDEYIRAAMENGIYEIKIIHGKGKGVLRRMVHSRLEKNAHVVDFRLDAGPSGWGATTVTLR
ncbi:MAG: Smr/MutS family protein [Deltaproteobacteria bacterium]|nr:Smr/MutS family protein [Deltaproteobacteria bacterium]